MTTTSDIKEEIDLAISLTVDLFKGDVDKASNWFQTSNPYFFDKSPFEIILLGEGYHIINFLETRLGRKAED